MKLPIIRHFQKNLSPDKLTHAIEALEVFTEHRSVKEEEMDVVGELITNLAGAIEVHKMIEEGMEERDAANAFAKRVLGSIDQ